MSTEIKISGTKVTVKRDAPTSPANVRPVDPMKGTRNPAHIQPNLPPALARKVRQAYEAGLISREDALRMLGA